MASEADGFDRWDEDPLDWLNRRDPVVSAALATRAALRVLPIMGRAFDAYGAADFGVYVRGAVILPALRALASAWSLTAAPAGADPTAARRALAAIRVALGEARPHRDDPLRDYAYLGLRPDAAKDALRAVRHALEAAVPPAGETAPGAALKAINCASSAFAAADDAWLDSGLLVRGESPEGLARRPLWLRDPPEWAWAAWRDLRLRLEGAGEGWSVWTGWVEGRWRGEGFYAPLEHRRVALPEPVWRAGPAAVNAEIARLTAEARSEGDPRDPAFRSAFRDLPVPDATQARLDALLDRLGESEPINDARPAAAVSDDMGEQTGVRPGPADDAGAEPPGAALFAAFSDLVAEAQAQAAGGGAAPAAPPSAPEPRPAPVSFVFTGGAARPVPASGLPEAAPDLLAGAWRGLRDLLDDVTATAGGRQDPRLGRVLGRLSEALGGGPETLDAGRLGVHARRLSEFARRADETMLAEDAAELCALDAQLALFLGALPEWRAVAGDLGAPMAAPEAEQAAVAEAREGVARMAAAAPEVFPEETRASLAELAEGAEPEPTPGAPAPLAPPAERRSYLRAARSLIRAVAGAAVEAVGSGVAKGLEKGAMAATVVALTAASAHLLSLAAALPAEFGWLTGVLSYLARALAAL